MPRILLVEDDLDTAQLVQKGLLPYDIFLAENLKAAHALLETTPIDLALIDGSLPDGDGFMFCAEMSKDPRFQQIPLILLTARSEINEKIMGLNSGAIDYITKPFQLLELKARVDSQLRRQNRIQTNVLGDSLFKLDQNFQRLTIHEKTGPIDFDLTPTEFRLLLILYKNQGSPVSRENLLKQVWSDQGMSIEIRGVDTHIAHLRKKISPYEKWIGSVYGKGYLFYKPEQLTNK